MESKYNSTKGLFEKTMVLFNASNRCLVFFHIFEKTIVYLMNRFLIVFGFLFGLQIANAQDSKVSGIVKDSASTKPVAYASVGLLDANKAVASPYIIPSV